MNEPVRVIHVLEVFAKGEDLFVMGPKPITGEWVDGTRVTPEVPTWGAFTTMDVYDGLRRRVMQSPALDVNSRHAKRTAAVARRELGCV